MSSTLIQAVTQTPFPLVILVKNYSKIVLCMPHTLGAQPQKQVTQKGPNLSAISNIINN